jgi:hypothetical protein
MGYTELLRDGESPSVTLSITNLTLTGMVLNLVLRHEKPATDVYPIFKSDTDPSGLSRC